MLRIGRRALLASASFAVFGLACGTNAQLPAAIDAIIKAVGDATDVIAKLTDNLYKATKTSLKIWDVGQARYERSEYLALARNLGMLSGSQSLDLLLPLESYIYDWQHRSSLDLRQGYFKSQWLQIQLGVGRTLSYVGLLLDRLKKTNGLLPATPTYYGLMNALGSRVSVLDELRTMDAPSTDAEVNKLQILEGKYKALHEQLAKLMDALDAYVTAS